MAIVDFPAEFVPFITRSAFYRQDRIARSRSVFGARGEVQDLGPIWRASVQVTPPQFGPERRQFETWMRGLRGGEVKVRLWDFDYQVQGPGGHGQAHAAYTGQAPHAVTWSTGAGWSTGASWGYSGALELGAAIAPGQTGAWLWGGTPGIATIAGGDTIGVDGVVALVAAAALPDATGRIALTLDATHQIDAPARAAVTVGEPFKVAFDWVNPAAVANETGVDMLPRYAMDFVEAISA